MKFILLLAFILGAFAEEDDGSLSVIDGQQRLTAIISFIKGKFLYDDKPFKLSSLVSNLTPSSIFFATTPALTSPNVSLAEKCPPPLYSLKPSYFSLAVKSAWDAGKT